MLESWRVLFFCKVLRIKVEPFEALIPMGRFRIVGSPLQSYMSYSLNMSKLLVSPSIAPIVVPI